MYSYRQQSVLLTFTHELTGKLRDFIRNFIWSRKCFILLKRKNKTLSGPDLIPYKIAQLPCKFMSEGKLPVSVHI